MHVTLIMGIFISITYASIPLLMHQYTMCLFNRPMSVPEPDAMHMTMIVTMTIL